MRPPSSFHDPRLPPEYKATRKADGSLHIEVQKTWQQRYLVPLCFGTSVGVLMFYLEKECRNFTPDFLVKQWLAFSACSS